MKYTEESLKLTKYISDKINNETFHHHFHILYDIACDYESSKKLTYLEIGCYAGASACLMLQRPNTNVISIDLGTPIGPNIVYENVSKLNIYNNNFEYIQGDSKNHETIEILSNISDSVDILFIDGDHSYSGVISDFTLYNQFVASGGYIIFDDYNDSAHSPEVKIAVDFLIETFSDKFKIIGTIPNKFGARPDSLLDGNLFIIKKL